MDSTTYDLKSKTMFSQPPSPATLLPILPAIGTIESLWPALKKIDRNAAKVRQLVRRECNHRPEQKLPPRAGAEDETFWLEFPAAAPKRKARARGDSHRGEPHLCAHFR